MSDQSNNFRKCKINIPNENSPLYNFLQAQKFVNNNQNTNSFANISNQFPFGIFKSNGEYQPSKKSKKIISELNFLNTRISDIKSERSIQSLRASEDDEFSSLSDRVNDSMLDSYQKYIIFRKAKEFKKGTPIWKIVLDEFERKISYDKNKFVTKMHYQPKINTKMNYKINKNSPYRSNKRMPLLTENNENINFKNNYINSNFNNYNCNYNSNCGNMFRYGDGSKKKYKCEVATSCPNIDYIKRRSSSFFRKKEQKIYKNKLPPFQDLSKKIPDYSKEKNEKIYENFELYDKYCDYQKKPLKFS